MTLKEYFSKKKKIKLLYKEKKKNAKDKKESKTIKKERKKELKNLERPICMKIFILILFFTLIAVLCFEIYYVKHRKNFDNGYFSFRYNQDVIFIDDYTDISNMWVVTTGGGVYAPSLVLIGYIDSGAEMDVKIPLDLMQEEFGGTKSEEETTVTDSFAEDNYILTFEDGNTYKILSKSFKKEDKLLSIMFVNAGDLSEKEQAYLYQVYETISLN